MCGIRVGPLKGDESKTRGSAPRQAGALPDLSVRGTTAQAVTVDTST